MESTNCQTLLLNLISKPVFCVKNHKIAELNVAAKQLQISEGTDICQLLTRDLEAYDHLQSGCLYLTLDIAGIPNSASVVRTEQCDVFMLDSESDDVRLQAMALAAQQLRIPLSNVMTISEQLQPDLFSEDDANIQRRIGQMHRGLFQMLRIITNMADTQRYCAPDALRMEPREFRSLIEEIMDKAKTLLEGSGHRIKFRGLDQPVIGMVSAEALERAIYNLISNAVKFSPKGSTIEIHAAMHRSMLQITVENSGDIIASHVLANLFTRYQRQPGIEDGRHGIGLGMALVRSVASAHGGTVLVDQPSEGGTRVTMTLSIHLDSTNMVSSPILRLGDYTGGWDHGLLELSETLEPELYCNS